MKAQGLVGRITEQASRAGVEVGPSLAGALADYVELLRHWNRRMNLTALRDDENGLDRLVVEPLVAAGRVPVGARTVVDIGSGGGSPAVPLKLAVPRLALRMVESKARKGAFLREVVRKLGLEDVMVETCRYEELFMREEFQAAADVVTVRAVRVEGGALQGLETLLRAGGALFLFRGRGDGDVPDGVWPVRWQRTYPLVESLGSRLVVLEKGGGDDKTKKGQPAKR